MLQPKIYRAFNLSDSQTESVTRVATILPQASLEAFSSQKSLLLQEHPKLLKPCVCACLSYQPKLCRSAVVRAL